MQGDRERADRVAIRNFAKFLEATGQPVAGVDEWPEDNKQGEIDAILGPFAVQHTSIDALPDGRRRDHQFQQVIGNIEKEFRGRLGFYLSIVLDWNAIMTGQDWKRVNQGLSAWISGDAATLPDGKLRIAPAPDVPFAFDVVKGGPLRMDGVFFSRWDPGDRSLHERLCDQLIGRHDKFSVLAAHRNQGKKTLLLLESSDIALISDAEIAKAFRTAFPNWPSELDELWFMHHVAPPTINIHDLRLGKTWIFDPTRRNILLENHDTARVA
jgi:hypothetical protein